MSSPPTLLLGRRLMWQWLWVLPLILLAANHMAGMLCLAIFDQDPRQVGWGTYLYAWQHTATGTKVSDKVVLCGAIGLFAAALGPFVWWVSHRPANPNVHGKARFATLAEIAAHGFCSGTGIVVGQLGRHLLRFAGPEFVLLSAPTRSGKGVSTVIPTLLTFEGSAVVLDIKGENYQLTSAYRAKHLKQTIFYFNPFCENSHRWNPLSYVSRDPNFTSRDLMTLAVILFPDDPHNPFFSHASRNVFVGLSLLLFETPELPTTMGEIVRQASGKGQTLKHYLSGVMAQRAQSATPLSTACRDALNRLLHNTDETLQNIQASFVAPLAIWSSPLVDKATSGDDFDLRSLRRHKMTVYLHIPAGEVMQAGLLLNLFFSQLINENVRTLPEHDPSLRVPCLLVMDEFTAIGKIAIVAKSVGFLAGYQLRLLLIIQDKAQLVATYGKEDAHNILANMGLVICFAPRQLEEAEHLSKIIGDSTVVVRSVQHANVGLLNRGQYAQTVTESEQKRAVMLPQELLAMPEDKALLIRRGMPVALVNKVVYYRDKPFRTQLSALPASHLAAAHGRFIPAAFALPLPHWERYTHQLSDSDHYLRQSSSSIDHPPSQTPPLQALAQSFFAQYLQHPPHNQKAP